MPQPESEVVRVLRAHRLSMNAAEDATMQMMGERWLEVERALNANISALANEMLRRAQTGETITASMVHRAERYQILKSQMAAEINKYNKDAAVIISNAQGEALQLGIDAAADAIFSSFPSGLSAAFDRINIGAVDSMIGMAGDGSPLNSLLKNDFGDAANGMLDALISGVAQGQGAEAVARQMAEGLAIGLDRSLLIARTELNRSYRAGTTEQYRQSGVTDGFMRLVARDEACLACIALDGEKFASADEMDDHPNGRCTCVPIIAGETPPEWEKAQDWFANQPESKQLEVLGPARLEMYKNGTPLSAFAEKAHSKEWGDSPKIIPLRDLDAGAVVGGADALPIDKDAFQEVQGIYKGDLSGVTIQYGENERGAGGFVGERESVFVNPEQSFMTADEEKQGIQSRIQRYEDKLTSADLSDEERRNFTDKLNEYKDKLENYIPYTLPENEGEIIIHELGHVIYAQVEQGKIDGVTDLLPPSKNPTPYSDTMMNNFVAMRDAYPVSEYGNKNFDEYFSESFVLYMRGDYESIHPDLLDLFRRISK